MTKTKSIILCLVILIVIFSGCNKQETISKSELQTSTTNAIINKITAEQETSESKTTTQKSDNLEITVANKQNPLNKNQQIRLQRKNLLQRRNRPLLKSRIRLRVRQQQGKSLLLKSRMLRRNRQPLKRKQLLLSRINSPKVMLIGYSHRLIHISRVRVCLLTAV